MRNLTLTVDNFTIGNYESFAKDIIIDMDLSDEEFLGILDRFSIREMIDSQGEIGILEEMDTDIIMKYLNDIGIETKWEDKKPKEELPKDKPCYIGDFILRITEDGALRVTADRGVISIHPKADNAVEIKSTKGGKQ